jgi:2,4-dienoyl-CoA reductase-like NADH-dependent reductase (Old Yellow Enzyme family)
MALPSELGSYDDRFIPGLKRLADIIHAHGSKGCAAASSYGRESLFLLKGQGHRPSPIRSWSSA